MVEHAQLTHTLLASLETLGFAPGDVVAALASTAFDISLLELFTPLLAGRRGADRPARGRAGPGDAGGGRGGRDACCTPFPR